ncbi:hypothetical protein Pan216_03920 [Planctomycetes bacterium Pan216]|uniref:Uncharacterized protein n=1 Tax=Kolteria novifilia TaxID=2527975 RepID=A0A518AXV9_9BACT|nr:hypothetical protein Pan216_03920 [Planctomycetes bacterium Pan216]
MNKTNGQGRQRNRASAKKPKKTPREELTRWLEMIVKPGEVTELFVKDGIREGLDIRPNFSGFYDSDHLSELVNEAVSWSGNCAGVYFRMNPVLPALLARSKNRVQPSRSVQAASRDDVVRRRLLMIDVDPIRPSGISANEEERKAAVEVARAILKHLKSEGWPRHATVDTGNGYSIFFGVDLPPDDEDLVRRVLKSLDNRFSTDKALVDTSVHDSARLARLPGTKNCKGDEVDDRTHRICRVLKCPDGALTPVPKELLERLAAQEVAPTIPDNPEAQQVGRVLSQALAYVRKMPPAISGKRATTPPSAWPARW